MLTYILSHTICQILHSTVQIIAFDRGCYSLTNSFPVTSGNITISHILLKTRFLPATAMQVRITRCLSVKCVNCNKTKETSAKILAPQERIVLSSFVTRKWLVETTHCTWNFGWSWPHSFVNANFQLIFAHSSSSVNLAKIVQLTTSRKCTTSSIFYHKVQQWPLLRMHNSKLGKKSWSENKVHLRNVHIQKKTSYVQLC